MIKTKSVVYLDCFSGISGDMLLGAFFHLGLPLEFVRDELSSLTGLDFAVEVEKTSLSGIAGRRLVVHSPSAQRFRHLSDIHSLLAGSGLSAPLQKKAGALFTRLAAAEAEVHGVDVEQIHFHEVGAVDTIVDIVGTLLALEYFDVGEVVCSPLPMGRGFVNCEHGKLPLPVPAVCELLRNVPVYGAAQEVELVTPTGALLAVGISGEFGTMPSMRVLGCGYGAGNNILKEQPNLLRVVLGERSVVEEAQGVEVIEANLDDWNTETFPYLSEMLFAAGALDVSMTSVLMKKGRPGHCLQVIASPDIALELKDIILSETTSIGLRFRRENRVTMARELVEVETRWGKVQAKLVKTPAGSVIYPEYEACVVVAQKNKIPLAHVYNGVVAAGLEE